MSSSHLLILLSVVLTVGVVIVLAVALIEVRTRLERIAGGLDRLESTLQAVESRDLRPLDGAVRAINDQFEIILGALPGIARKAALVAQRRPR